MADTVERSTCDALSPDCAYQAMTRIGVVSVSFCRKHDDTLQRPVKVWCLLCRGAVASDITGLSRVDAYGMASGHNDMHRDNTEGS